MKLMKEKAEQLLQRCEVVVITSVNEEGYPRPVPMSKIKSEGYSVVWMATGNDSLKTKDFRLNPKAGLCYSLHSFVVDSVGPARKLSSPSYGV